MNIIDFSPREFGAEEEKTLQEFAGLVMDQMELRLSARKAIASLSQIITGPERPKDLTRFITVSAWSRKILVDGEWMSFEEFLSGKLGVLVSHGIDPDTARQLREKAVPVRHRGSR